MIHSMKYILGIIYHQQEGSSIDHPPHNEPAGGFTGQTDESARVTAMPPPREDAATLTDMMTPTGEANPVGEGHAPPHHLLFNPPPRTIFLPTHLRSSDVVITIILTGYGPWISDWPRTGAG